MASTPSIETIRAVVKAQLDTIAGPLPAGGAGKVFDRPRHTTQDVDVIADFLDSDSVLRITWIEMRGDSEREDDARHKFWLHHKVTVVHHRHFDDASSPNSTTDFDREIAKLKDFLRRNTSIFGIPADGTHRTVTETIPDFRMFVGRMCHYVELSFEVEASEIIAP